MKKGELEGKEHHVEKIHTSKEENTNAMQERDSKLRNFQVNYYNYLYWSLNNLSFLGRTDDQSRRTNRTIYND